MTIMLLIPLSVFFGLLVATFAFISAWFAWTPLPLILRVPLALAVVSPFGLIASGFPAETKFAYFLAAVVVACILTGFAADRSAAFTFCMIMIALFGVLPLLVGVFMNPAMTDQLRLSAIGFVIIVMLALALLCLPLRLLGYRLQRLGFETGDQAMRLSSGMSVDEWIADLDREARLDGTFAEFVGYVRERGIPDQTAKRVANAICRSLDKPSPRSTAIGTGGGFSSWLQWATTGPRREQYSMRQLMLWVASSAILFAVLARIGIDLDTLLWWPLALPATLAFGAAINLLSWGWLSGRPAAYRVLLISGGCVSVGVSGSLIQRMPPIAGSLLMLAPAFTIGSMLAMNYWLLHLRREGFRLIRR